MYTRKVSLIVRNNLKSCLCVRYKHDPPSENSKNYYDPDAINENPLDRCKRFFSRDFKELVNKCNDPFGEYEEDKIFPKTVDVMIIGGGVIGSSIAYWLQNKCRDGLTIAVVDKDLSVNKSILSTQEVFYLIK